MITDAMSHSKKCKFVYGTLVPVPTLPVLFKFVQFQLNEFKVVQFIFADVKAPVTFKYEQGTV